MAHVSYSIQHEKFDLRAFVSIGADHIIVANEDAKGTTIPEKYCILRDDDTVTQALINKCVAGCWVADAPETWEEQLGSAGFIVKRTTGR